MSLSAKAKDLCNGRLGEDDGQRMRLGVEDPVIQREYRGRREGEEGVLQGLGQKERLLSIDYALEIP